MASEYPTNRDKFADSLEGCLFLGALGDAFGYTVEFSSINDIERIHGGRIRLEKPSSWDVEETIMASDDTQMTLFTAEACAKAMEVDPVELELKVVSECRMSYLDWLHTQNSASPDPQDDGLMAFRQMYARRAPGNTCLYALIAGGQGNTSNPINDSKGCGGIMRVAPIAFLPNCSLKTTWRVGCQSAAITHGHRMGWMPAGALAVILRLISQGNDVVTAAEIVMRRLDGMKGGDELASHIRSALAFKGREAISPEEIMSLGGGWVGEECLAIGLAAAVMSADVLEKIDTAVNHSGDSDSTGSITGQLLGTQLGASGVTEHEVLGKLIERIDIISPVRKVTSRFVTAAAKSA